ncbi:hypothetical protein [Clostridium sp. FP1]|uniref:hypothetical protein n=1 Tax=Clostridium sp. FP1 TaxID=2724076 RepID=UPI0013E99C71|nr:hypothetical protein [Clostridium sp. FP1]MBZ9637718.1 hypothetical protein [Clostridium sp. FP1]
MKKIIYSVMSLIIMLSVVLENSVQSCKAAELENTSDTTIPNFVIYCPFSSNGIHHYTARGTGNLYKGTFTNHTLILGKTGSSEYQCTYCNDVMITQADAETCKSTGYAIGTYGLFNIYFLLLF